MYEKAFPSELNMHANSLRSIALTVCFLLISAVCHAEPAETFDAQIESIMQHIAEKDLQGALAKLNKALELQPGSSDARMLRSQVYLQLGKVQQALDDLDIVLLENPADDATQLYRCLVKESQAQSREEAKQCYATVAQNIEQRSSSAALAHNGDYVRLVIMADLPYAENVRQAYLKKCDANNYAEAHEAQAIRNFSYGDTIPLLRSIQDAQDAAKKSEKQKGIP